MAATFVTNRITATNTLLPIENLPPAPGEMGLVTVVNNGANTATLTSTALNAGGFILPVGSPPIELMLGGNKVLVTGVAPSVSYAYASASRA